MKKILSIILASLVAVSCLALSSCDSKGKTLKFGLGVVSTYGKTANADGETKGNATVTNTAAAVLVNDAGKIVKCVIDAVDGKAEFDSKGAVVPAAEYKTKGELGKSYGMSSIGKTEWDEQVAALCKLAEGKTLDEVKAFLAQTGKGSADVINAGCTIIVTDLIKALEKAMNNAADSKATAKDTLTLKFVTKQENATNATADKSGSCSVTSNICAGVIEDGKVAAMKSDAASVKFTFTAAGISETDTAKAILTKRELGNNYGMSAYGQDLNGDGVVKEWFEQADVLDAACIGKTADEIGALAVDGYGVESLKTAGCTIAISDMVAVAVKAAK